MMKRSRLLCACLALATLVFPLHVLALEGELSASPVLSDEQAAMETENPVPGFSGQEPAPKPAQPQEEKEDPVIRVSIPATGKVILNPYKLEVNGSTEQVVSHTYRLKNESEIPVTVWVKATGIVPEGSGAKFVPAPPQADEQEKQAFIYAEFRLPGEDWEESYISADNQVVASEGGGDSRPVLTLFEGEEGEFRLFGRASVPPTTMWTADDTIDVSLSFSFTAVGDWPED